MKPRRPLPFLVAAAWLLCAGCGNLPGKPAADAVPIDPDQVKDFGILYKTNCSGCHGADAKNGAALPIGDPVYLAIADDTQLRKVISNGVKGASMPAFAKSAGGMLTDEQVGILARGLRETYAKSDVLAGGTAPAYTAAETGDATRGAAVYGTFCAACHGSNGKGGAKATSIVSGSFLALVSDQELRTIVIVGRPDLGAPDWRNDVAGQPLTSQQISDVVAWLAAQRPQFPGSPYPSVAAATGEHP